MQHSVASRLRSVARGGTAFLLAGTAFFFGELPAAAVQPQPPSTSGVAANTSIESVLAPFDYGNIDPAPVIRAATIDGVSPDFVTRGQVLAVRATFFLHKPVSALELRASTQVWIDDALAPPVTVGPEAAVPTSESWSSSRPVVAATETVLNFRVRVPELPGTAERVNVSLYSAIDRSWIAGAISTINVMPKNTAAPVSTTPAEWLKWSALGLLAIVAAVHAFGQLRRRGYTDKTARADDVARPSIDDKSGETWRLPAVLNDREGEPTVPAVPESITAALMERRLALVLGAGASAQAGVATGVSLWIEVLARIRALPLSVDREEQVEELRLALIREGPSRVLDAMVETYGRVEIAKVLREIIGKTAARRSEFHDRIAKIPCDIVIDLTSDQLVAKAFPDAQVFTPARCDGLTVAIRERRRCILKPFGDLSEPDLLILTAADLRRAMTRAPEFERALAGAFASHSHFFLGVGIQGLDEYLSMLPANISSSGREHVAVMPHNSRAALWKAGTGKRHGIRIQEYQPSAHYRELVVMLDRWLAQISASTRVTERRVDTISQQQPRLSRVTLENIGIFEYQQLDLSESWTLLLGNNGGGKSTVLRAIGIALAGTDPRASRSAARLLRTGAKSGRILLEIGPDKIVTELVRDSTSVQLHSPQLTPLQAGRMLVLGFPVLRGVSQAALPGPRELEEPEPSVNDVAPLMDGAIDTRLDDLKQWIINLFASDDARGGNEAAMLATLRQLITDLIPTQRVSLSRVDRKFWTIWLDTPDGEVEFDAISQGMSSILNWIGVLLRRLHDVYPDAPKPEHGRALVLVDEIDAHLHPSWQRRLVEITRKFFPNVQIIATSHSPFLAGSVDQGELRIVGRDPHSGKPSISVARENISGQRVEEILTSSLFSLDTTRSPDAERDIRSFVELYEKNSLSEEESTEFAKLSVRMTQLNFAASGRARSRLATQKEPTEVDLFENLSSLSADDADRLRARFAAQSPDTAASPGKEAP